jgi:SAM-dependent methyltransferase
MRLRVTARSNFFHEMQHRCVVRAGAFFCPPGSLKQGASERRQVMATTGTDRATLDAYDKDAEVYARDWHSQPPPSDLHAAVRKYFKLGGTTADIGCGSGRDTAWLNANSYPCVGFDASDGLLAEAHRRYPALMFLASPLPELPNIDDGSFDNVLCETVIMHLPSDAVAPSVRRMIAILKSGGNLYLTWRVTKDADLRSGDGRLYAAFGADSIRTALTGTDILLDEEVTSASSGKAIHRMVARKR